jgi:hypothetical protein
VVDRHLQARGVDHTFPLGELVAIGYDDEKDCRYAEFIGFGGRWRCGQGDQPAATPRKRAPRCADLAPMRLAGVACRRVFSCSLCCEPDGMPLMVMRQMRLLRRRDNIFRLQKLGGLVMVPCGVLMMLGRQLMEFG